jgi:hypothetical protein
VARGQASIIGAEVPDQTRLRPEPPIRAVDDFLDFLARLEAVFGPLERPREPTTGDRFRL